MPIKTGRYIFLFIFLLLLPAGHLFAQELSLTAELSQSQMWLGESVRMNLILQGSEDPIAPNLDIDGISVQGLGGSVRSSRSVTNINGNVTETVFKAYVYSYQLTPEKPGRFTIPSITVAVNGVNLRSRPLNLDVKTPSTSNDYSLDIRFDKKRIYVDESVLMQIRFATSTNLRSLEIRVPGLEKFEFTDLGKAKNVEKIGLNVNGREIAFYRGEEGVFIADLHLKPDTPASISFPLAIARLEYQSGTEKVQDVFGRMREQPKYERMTIQGQSDALKVLPFPDDNQPLDFFGLSGDVQLEVEVDSREVHIGDPVTLTLTVSGLNNADVSLPSLEGLLGRGIDIPATRVTELNQGDEKTLSQTIRINNPSVSKIPAIQFSYFDPRKGQYRVAESKEIPIRVLDTEIITSADLEGGGQGEIVRETLENRQDGIFYNYAGPELLVTRPNIGVQIFSSPLFYFAILLPPACFLLILLYNRLFPRFKARLLRHKNRKAWLRSMKKRIARIHPDDVKSYLQLVYTDLHDFLKEYPEDLELVVRDVHAMQHVLYGRGAMDHQEARQLTESLINRLMTQKEEAHV